MTDQAPTPATWQRWSFSCGCWEDIDVHPHSPLANHPTDTYDDGLGNVYRRTPQPPPPEPDAQ